MAFPQTAAPTETSINTPATAHLVTMPPTINSGDLLLVFLCTTDGSAPAPSVTTPSGWTQIMHQVSGATENRTAIYAKVADGTEDGTTVDFVTDINANMAAQVYRVTDWRGVLAGVEADATPAEGVSTSPDPPSESATWGNEDNLWFAVTSATNDQETASAFPTGFGNGVNTQSGGNANEQASVISCRKEDAVTTLDPDTFTITGAEAWVAQTLVVRPAADSAPGLSPALFGTTQRRSTLLRM